MSGAPYKAHGSHLPVLEGVLKMLPRPVYALELGAGEYSTPWFKQEADFTWVVEPMVEWQPKPFHSNVVEPTYWPEHPPIGPDGDEVKWSIALVDHAVGLRKEAVERLRGNCHCIVVHDTQVRDHHLYGWGDGTLRAREGELVLHVADKWHGLWTTAIFGASMPDNDGVSTPICDLAEFLANQGHMVAWDVKGFRGTSINKGEVAPCVIDRLRNTP
jgi:hypothetical protein